MVAQHRSSAALHTYVLAVSAAGLATLVFLVVAREAPAIPSGSVVFWALMACVAVTESFPVLFRRGTSVSTTADAFAFAILLGWGTTAAAFALVVGLVVGDLLRRVAVERLLFNAGQYGLLMAVAGGVYEAFGGGRPFTAWDLPALAAAAVVFFLGNLVLVGVVMALAYGRDFVTDLKEGVRIKAWPYLLVFGMAPVLLIIAEYSAALVPLLMLPQLAVFRALKDAAEADEHRVAAERAVKAAEALATEKARVAQAEHELVEKLQESDRLKDDLLATVSHELRTPLAGLLGALATLSGRGDALSPTQRNELVAMAGRQGSRLKELIEQLLLAARFEHARAEQGDRPAVDAAILAGQARRRAGGAGGGGRRPRRPPTRTRPHLRAVHPAGLRRHPPRRWGGAGALHRPPARPGPGWGAAGRRAGQAGRGRPLRATPPPGRGGAPRHPSRPARAGLRPSRVSMPVGDGPEPGWG